MNGNCLVCTGELTEGFKSWHFICKQCDYEKALLQPIINSKSAHELIDEEIREHGLRNLRISNFQKLVDCIKSIKPLGGNLLDVGCAHGWFLEAAKNDFKVCGIEPDKKIFDALPHDDLYIRNGYFPDVLNDTEKFDVITFNDVIEHIPDIKNIIASCHQLLNKDGLLVLNLPSSNGVFYKLSRWLCRIGFTQFFDRLWQKDLPSPHLHYFNSVNILTLLENNAFVVIEKGTLPTIRLAGLYSRITYTGNFNWLSRIFIYAVIVIFLPILTILPCDTVYVIASRK